MKKLALPLLVMMTLLVTSCEKTEEVVDVTPPPEPEPYLITVSGPDDQGRLTVTGENSSVEGNATVLASNTDGLSSGEGQANPQGAFSLQLTGDFFHSIVLRARDEAGNTSSSITLQAGSPFSLSGIAGGGQEGVIGTTYPDSVKFEILDSNSEPVSGAKIVFIYDSSSGDAEATFSPDTVISDQSGLAASQVTLGMEAGSLVIAPEGLTPGDEAIDFSTAGVLECTALPGAADTLVLVSGSGQKDGPGETLTVPIIVEARDSWDNPVPGTALVYTPSGDGQTTPPAGTTGNDGRASISWTLAGTLGAQTLQVSSGSLSPLVVPAEADEVPTITSVTPVTPVDAGDPVFIHGDNFCAQVEFNTVTLGGIAMVVEEASEVELKAIVPWGLSEGVHSLGLTVGNQTAVENFSFQLNPPPAQVTDHSLSGGQTSVELVVPNMDTKYLVIPYSLKRSGPWTYSAFNFGIDGGTTPRSEEVGSAEIDPVQDLHRRLLTPPSTALPPVMDRGDRVLADREVFYCLNDPFGNVYDAGSYTTVTADLKYTGSNVLLYVDVNTNLSFNNLDSLKVKELGDRFDDQDHGIDVAAFGQETDIDGNGRVMVLLTPIVNGMSDHPSMPPNAYIGGFFNSADLNAFGEVPGTSNGGEIFYSLVPDPYHEFSGITHPIESTVQDIKAVLAHEFQHMINHGRRHCSPADGGNGYDFDQGEKLWLNEGLSHLAEDLCGYHDSNRGRVGLYLHSAATRLTSLEYVDPLSGNQTGNSLAERGAAYLFCRYIEDRWPLIARDLIGGPTSGADNVALASGQEFDQTFKEWAAAIYLDDRDLDGDGTPEDLGPIYRFTSHNIRVDFPPQGPLDEPLSIDTVYFHDPDHGSTLFASSVNYLHLAVHGTQSPPPGGTINLEFSGTAGGEMGFLLLRVHN